MSQCTKMQKVLVPFPLFLKKIIPNLFPLISKKKALGLEEEALKGKIEDQHTGLSSSWFPSSPTATDVSGPRTSSLHSPCPPPPHRDDMRTNWKCWSEQALGVFDGEH